MIVSELIGRWYDINKRYLPWREDKSPYRIWLSEIILQQTRVAQGLPYYERFIDKFPSINHIANSNIEDILLLWQGLGYYSRARNLHKAARIISLQYKGDFPCDYKGIKNLPGIGDYTAAAIASLAFNLPHAAVDGNVYRVLSRYLGIRTAIDTTLGKKEFQQAANELLDNENPGRHNQAMIELGALVCLPKNPACSECPLNSSCYAKNNSSISELPIKAKKIASIDRYFYYLVIRKAEKLYIRQRSENDIWALLYDFPLIELEHPIGITELMSSDDWKIIFGDSEITIRSISEEYKHILSHQKLHARFVEIEIDSSIVYDDVKEILIDEIENYPFPRLIYKYWEKQKATD